MVWLITRYADVRQVMADSRFSNALVPPPPEGKPRPQASGAPPLLAPKGIFTSYDPPQHTGYRRMLAGNFSLRRINELRPRVEEIVGSQLGAMEQAGPVADLVTQFAHPVASLVICELLGVPAGDRPYLQSLLSITKDLGFSRRPEPAIVELIAYLRDFAARERKQPGPGLAGSLMRDHGDDLADEEVTNVILVLLRAGYEPPANMLALGPLLLLRNPDQLRLLRADPEAARGAVEELLRYLSVVSLGAIRRATQSITVGGQLIQAGEYVMCSLTSANRDDQVQYDPDRLDILRKPTAHLAFGHGPHQCLGQQLARLQFRTAIPALFRRFPGLESAIPFEDIDFYTDSPVHGVHAAPVKW
jgi:cytochrome P450